MVIASGVPAVVVKSVSLTNSARAAVVAENTLDGKSHWLSDASMMTLGKIAEASNIDVEGCSTSRDVSIHA